MKNKVIPLRLCNKNIVFDNPDLLKHINSGGNYGVMGGGPKNLVVIDFDNSDLQDIIIPKLLPTFTVKTGTGKLHKYFFSDNAESFKILNEKMQTLADVQGIGKQVVGAGSIHPNGNIYEVIDDKEIAFLPYNEIRALLMLYDKKPKKEKVVWDKPKTDIQDDFLNRLKGQLSIEQVLNSLGVNTDINPTACPFHSSKGGKCLGFERDIAHCFHCDNAWNIFSFVKEMKKCDFKEALEYLADLAGMTKELYESRQKYIDSLNNGNSLEGNKMIKLPTAGKLVSEFAVDVGEELSDKEILFYRGETQDIVEIGKIKHNNDGKEEIEYKGFVPVSANRFITLAEKYCTPYILIENDEGYEKVRKSMSNNMASAVLVSDNFRNVLPIINKIFTIPQPMMYQGKLTFPKAGYDERFSSWLPHDAPKISNPEMKLEEAKVIINKMYCEFCFKDEEQDKTNAIAGLLTPFIRGLYPSQAVTPLFAYLANRERAGKDCCANCTGILYEGIVIEESALSDGKKFGNSTDELRKKVLSAFISGRKRMHFANNKGEINNAILEGLITNLNFTDRLLGSNRNLSFPNDMEKSISGNTGLTMTPDLINRTIFINLFLDIEDANTRQFKNKYLHAWIIENREEILSALFSLIRNWIDKGKPNGTIPFASFPEWSNICGGIMEAAGYGNPCKPNNQNEGVTLNPESEDMKLLFEQCYEHYPDEYITKQNIVRIVEENHEDMFSDIDFSLRSGQTIFGSKLVNNIGRFFSGIKLFVKDKTIKKTSQWKYKFMKEGNKVLC